MKGGLGRGLGSLFGNFNEEENNNEVKEVVKEKKVVKTEEVVDDKNKVLEIEIGLIDRNENQPRKNFDEKALKELSQSIKQHGVIQPLILQKVGERYLIVAGERRFRASRMAGLKKVPAIIKEYDKQQLSEVAIIENLQREDLNPIESAKAIQALIEEFGSTILEETLKESLPPISREKLANIAMATKESRSRLNEITHPLVQKEIETKLERLQKEQFQGIVVIEAALLIEAGYKSICDELWYVYAPIEDRKRRMRQNRGYTEQKIEHILAGQLSEEQFLANADVVIENPDRKKEEENQNLSKQIITHLKERLERIS